MPHPESELGEKNKCYQINSPSTYCSLGNIYSTGNPLLDTPELTHEIPVPRTSIQESIHGGGAGEHTFDVCDIEYLVCTPTLFGSIDMHRLLVFTFLEVTMRAKVDRAYLRYKANIIRL